MKILYAIQGTGNGHISRAIEIIPYLRQMAEVDILVSGIQADLSLPFPVDYQHRGLSFIFGQKGGVALWPTFKRLKTKALWQAVNSLPVEKYDLVLNDFEPVAAWAARKKGVLSIGLSHQAAVQHPASPKPLQKDPVGQFILKHYAPTDRAIGFHFDRFAPAITTPIIRRAIREAKTYQGDHYTVYLPAYAASTIIHFLSAFPDTSFHIFSKHDRKAYRKGNIQIFPVSQEGFMESLLSCEGVLCGAGFETPAEALYLQKKLLVIPMKNQWEQQCNAAALQKMGVAVFPKLEKTSENLFAFQKWLDTLSSLAVHYPDETERLLKKILENPFAHDGEEKTSHFSAIP